MRTAYRSGHYDRGIAVVCRVLPTTFGRIVPALDNQPGLLLSPSGIRLFFLTRIASSLSGYSCSVSLLTESLVVCLSCSDHITLILPIVHDIIPRSGI